MNVEKFEYLKTYSRKEIHECLGGGNEQSSIVTQKSKVLCLCVDPEINPSFISWRNPLYGLDKNEQVYLVGRGDGIERNAETLIKFKEKFLVFLKAGKSQWQYVGNYKVRRPHSVSESESDIAFYSHGAKKITPENVGVIFLKKVREPQEIIKEITDSFEKGEHYIYRGVNGYKDDFGDCQKDKEDRVASSLYRRYRKYFKDEIWSYEFELWQEEEFPVIKAKNKLYSNGTRNIEVLTDLKHFGASVNVVDFSCCLYVALFFACSGKFGEEGELIILPTRNVQKIDEIDYDLLIDGIIDPVKTETSKKRIKAQKSIFVYSQIGYLKQEEWKWKGLKIQPEEKDDILKYLKNNYDISEMKIYNDLLGFIQSEKNHEERKLFVLQSIELKRQNKNPIKKVSKVLKAVEKEMSYKDVVRDLNEAVKIVCKDKTLISDRICAFLFHTTAWSNYNLRDYEKASIAFKKQIEIFEKINKRFGTPYFGCGKSEYHLKEYESAIKCLNKEIKFGHSENKAEVYLFRGLAKRDSGEEGAQEDFEKIRDYKPEFAEHFLRGVEKLDSGDEEGAQEDFKKAQKLEPWIEIPYLKTDE